MTWITTKLLGYVSGGLGIALVLTGATLGLQTYRLDLSQKSVVSLTSQLKDAKAATDLVTTVANQRGEDLKARDVLIGQQSGSIDALALAAQQYRSVYTAGIAKADQGAKSNEARAADILALPAPAPDARCEAARTLILEELRNVR